MTDLQPGDRIDQRYEIVRVMNVGGMGAIYEARTVAGGSAPALAKNFPRLALKMLLPRLATSDDARDFRQRFQAECKFLEAIAHPGVPRFIEYLEDQHRFFLVMEFIQGRNLEEELEERLRLGGNRFPIDQAIRDATQVLEILDYLHHCNPPILHRDIKPANLIREQGTGRVRLVDFGLARALESNATQSQVGTIGYASLEQLQGKSEPRSDLYSLAASIHHLLSGVEPRPLRFDDIRKLRPEISEEFAVWLHRGLQSEARDRFASATVMLDALRSMRKALPLDLDNEEPTSSSLTSARPADSIHTDKLDSLPNFLPLSVPEPIAAQLQTAPPVAPIERPALAQEIIKFEPIVTSEVKLVAQNSQNSNSLATKIAVAACVGAAFLAGFAIRPKQPDPAPSGQVAVASASPSPSPISENTPVVLQSDPASASPSPSVSSTETPTQPPLTRLRPKPTPKPPPKPVKPPEPQGEHFSLDAPKYPTRKVEAPALDQPVAVSRPSFQPPARLDRWDPQIHLGSDWRAAGRISGGLERSISFKKTVQGNTFKMTVYTYLTNTPRNSVKSSFLSQRQSWRERDDLPGIDLGRYHEAGSKLEFEALISRTGRYFVLKLEGRGNVDPQEFETQLQECLNGVDFP